MKYNIFLFFFFAWILSISAKNIVLPENTPFYKVPDPTTSAVLIVQKEMQVEVTNIKQFRYTVGPFLIDSPLYEITPPGQKSVWAAPGFEYQQKTGKIILRKNKTLCTQALFCLAGAILTAFLCFIKQKKQFLTYLLPGISILLFCAGLMGYAYGASGEYIQNLYDEHFYYAIAKQILSFDFSGQWKYTIGLPIFYLPVLIFTNSGNILEFYKPFILVNILFCTPILLYCAYLIGRKFSGHKYAFSAVLMFLILIFFWQFRYQVDDTINNHVSYITASYPHWTTYNVGYPLYNIYTWLGCNAMSDTPSTMLLLLTTVLLFWLPPKKTTLMLVAVLFSFCCLIRMNNILYAPALFFLFLWQYDKLNNWKNRFNHLLFPGILFAAVFVWQPLVQWHQFGSPFITGYSLHDNVDWQFNQVTEAAKFLLICNKIFFLPALLALLWNQNHKFKIFVWLWLFPTFFFYLPYTSIFNNATRFIMPFFPILTLTIVACPLWYNKTNWRGIRLIACVVTCIATICTWIPEKWINTDGPWGITGKNAEILTIAGICIAALFALSFAVEYYFYREQNNPGECKNILPYLIYSVLFILLWIEPTGYGVFALSLLAFFSIIKNILQNNKELCKDEI